MTSDKLNYGTFELCAPGMVDRVQLAQIMFKALGRTIIPPREVTFEEWVEQAHIPEGSFHEGMQRMYADYAKYGFAGGNALVLRAVLGREPRSLEAFFKELSQSEG